MIIQFYVFFFSSFKMRGLVLRWKQDVLNIGIFSGHPNNNYLRKKNDERIIDKFSLC